MKIIYKYFLFIYLFFPFALYFSLKYFEVFSDFYYLFAIIWIALMLFIREKLKKNIYILEQQTKGKKNRAIRKTKQKRE